MQDFRDLFWKVLPRDIWILLVDESFQGDAKAQVLHISMISEHAASSIGTWIDIRHNSGCDFNSLELKNLANMVRSCKLISHKMWELCSPLLMHQTIP